MHDDKEASRSRLTQEPLGGHAKSKSDKYERLVGYALIACGLIFNEWMIGIILSPDANIILVQFRAMIWSLDAFLILAGVFIIEHPPYGRLALVCLMPILSLVTCSFVIYATLETFPSLIMYMPFAHVKYYAERATYVVDNELVYKHRPSFALHTDSFKGDHYRDSYRVDVQPMSYSVVYDQYGFRNDPMPLTGWDVAVLGDSFVEYGHDENDTVTSRFTALTGLTARNLGTSGYGPFQYIAVLKKYALTPKPKYVLFCFFEGNDIANINHYLQWQKGKQYGAFEIIGRNFIQRYATALADILYLPLTRALERDSAIPADLVTLQVGNASIKTVFGYKNETRTLDELLRMHEWTILKDLLSQFKSISSENGIVPIVLFIPTKTHIYAQYSTSTSGAEWMTIRDQQIAAKDHTETAVRVLCEEIGIELISLSPAFESAARKGKLLYYPFDTHWNSEGRQVAATVLAEALSSREKKSSRPLASFESQVQARPWPKL